MGSKLNGLETWAHSYICDAEYQSQDEGLGLRCKSRQSKDNRMIPSTSNIFRKGRDHLKQAGKGVLVYLAFKTCCLNNQIGMTNDLPVKRNYKDQGGSTNYR